MQGYAAPEDSFRRRTVQLIDRVEAGVNRAVRYVDRVIVPEVRRETGSTARLLASHLDRLAERLHPADRKPGL
jgi:hypothetical protein